MNIEAIRSCIEGRADAAIVMSEVNRKYLTGFAATDGYYLITADKAILFMDSRYIEAAKREASGCDEIILFNSLQESVQPVLSSLGINSVITECDRMMVSSLKNLNAKLSVQVIADEALDSAIDSLRSVKSDYELMCIKKAQSIAESAFEHILKFIKVGRTEREIGLELDYFMLKNGAQALSFETIAVSGVNGSMPHGVPSEKKIENGDFITMDYGAVYAGYHSDMTRTIAVGAVTSEQARVYETVLAAQNAAYSVIKPGVLCREADLAARAVIERTGYGRFFGHGLGHGVGIEIHEKPRLSPKSDDVLEFGNVVTNEPGIYREGSFGVRIEDMVFVTADGCTSLTNCPKELIVL